MLAGAGFSQDLDPARDVVDQAQVTFALDQSQMLLRCVVRDPAEMIADFLARRGPAICLLVINDEVEHFALRFRKWFSFHGCIVSTIMPVLQLHMRNAARSDANQQLIIGALRNIGVQVYYIKLPLDLLLSGGALKDFNLLMEIKMPGESLSGGQQEFFLRWPGRKCVVHNVTEALEAVLGKDLLK